MKLSIKRIEIIICSLLILSVLVGLLVFGVGFFANNYSKSIIPASNSSPSKETVDIASVISEIKIFNGTLEYESNNIEEFVSLVFKENERYKSIIVDTNTGKQISFEDLIKNEELNNFKNKELELLNFKYPEFIIKGITETQGYKIYYVKDNEVIIFYYDYTFIYEYNEIVSLRVNYNEIKDYLNFNPILDDSYEVENGFDYDSDKKTIAITFDDGPSRTYNSKILDVLNRNKAHATFYMVGNMMYSCQKCVFDTYNSGNEIGSHTYEHMNIKKNTIEDVANSLNKTNSIYNKITGDNIKTIRPPYGSYNADNLENINNPLILWNLDTQDWRYRDVNYIVNYIKEHVSDGSIILMHELYKTSYEALEIILPWLYASGYQVVSVSELAELKGKTIETGHVYSSFK